MVAFCRCFQRKVSLKKPVPLCPQSKHGPAQHGRCLQFSPCPRHVFDAIRFPDIPAKLPHSRDHLFMVALAGFRCQVAVSLAWWACVYRVELMSVSLQILQSIALHKLEGIARLVGYIHSDNLKTCAVVSHTSPPATAE